MGEGKINTDHMNSSDRWDLIIRPKTGWFDLNLKDLWRYRDLISMFIRRDFVTLYKQTVLGPLWYVIQPLLTTLVFTIIFGRVAKIPTDKLPPFIFYMAGNIVWSYFAANIQRISDTFSTNAHLFGKVYFPRLTIPIAGVMVNIIQFVIQFSLFIGFYLFFIIKGAPIEPTLWIAGLPILLFQMALLGLGIGILMSAMTTKYKDLRFALAFIIQIWMYATPVIYPLTQVPLWLRPYYVINPMVSVVECFRYAFFGTSAIQWNYIAVSWIVTLVLLVAGIALFNRIEKTFIDTV